MRGRERRHGRSDTSPNAGPPFEHLLHIYETDRVFLDTLEGFVAGGLRAGEGVIVIGTAAHVQSLEERLHATGVDLESARAADAYTSLDAEDLLSQFMVDGWPDKDRFQRIIVRLLDRARGTNRKVRAFGEMVAVLWKRGDFGATVRLEYLWHQLCQTEGLSLLCAYPRAGFPGDATRTINELVALHSGVVAPPQNARRLADVKFEPGTPLPPE